MSKEFIDDFNEEKIVVYKEETYSVRDNGAILRHPKKEGKKRQLDGIWTFGKTNPRRGYLEIASVSIHRIIATAFHGSPPTSQHVVDHIDTNRQNNRPENLRWVTKFENVMLNPITRKKIELLCGCSIEEVFDDISILHGVKLPIEYSWMKTVTVEEAKQSHKRWKNWVKNKIPTNVGMELWDKDIRKSKTYRAAQKNWHLAGVFPNCPSDEEKQTLEDYQANLKPGSILFERDNEIITVIDSAINQEIKTLNVKCSRSGTVKEHCLIIINLENEWFVHSIKAYFDGKSLEKYFTLAQGEQWEGGDVFDDYV